MSTRCTLTAPPTRVTRHEGEQSPPSHDGTQGLTLWPPCVADLASTPPSPDLRAACSDYWQALACTLRMATGRTSDHRNLGGRGWVDLVSRETSAPRTWNGRACSHKGSKACASEVVVSLIHPPPAARTSRCDRAPRNIAEAPGDRPPDSAQSPACDDGRLCPASESHKVTARQRRTNRDSPLTCPDPSAIGSYEGSKRMNEREQMQVSWRNMA